MSLADQLREISGREAKRKQRLREITEPVRKQLVQAAEQGLVEVTITHISCHPEEITGLIQYFRDEGVRVEHAQVPAPKLSFGIEDDGNPRMETQYTFKWYKTL